MVRPAATLEAGLRDIAASPEELKLACTLVGSVQVVQQKHEGVMDKHLAGLRGARHGLLA